MFREGACLPSQTQGGMRVLLSSSADQLEAALSASTTFAVVEAEFGSREVQGSSDLLTLNHHVRPERACPCSFGNEVFADVRGSVEVVGISHFDLDTLGGIMALMGRKPTHDDFWALAAHVDLNGPHRAHELGVSLETRALVAGFWAWSRENRLFAPRDGSVQDVTEFITNSVAFLEGALSTEGGTQGLADRGREFLGAQDELSATTLVADISVLSGQWRVFVRKHDGFVNALYRGESGVADVIVGLNTAQRSVTVSRESDKVPVNCRDLVQSMWGPEAGGHAGIAGSPRDREMTDEDAEAAVTAVVRILMSASRPAEGQ